MPFFPFLFFFTDSNPNDASSYYWDWRPFGKQATLEERVACLKKQIWETDDVLTWWRRRQMTLGNIVLCSAVYSKNVHVLCNIMLLVCAHNHFARYVESCMEKKKISRLGKKQVILCSLPIVHGLIISMEESLCRRPGEVERRSNWMQIRLL